MNEHESAETKVSRNSKTQSINTKFQLWTWNVSSWTLCCWFTWCLSQQKRWRNFSISSLISVNRQQKIAGLRIEFIKIAKCAGKCKISLILSEVRKNSIIKNTIGDGAQHTTKLATCMLRVFRKYLSPICILRIDSADWSAIMFRRVLL